MELDLGFSPSLLERLGQPVRRFSERQRHPLESPALKCSAASYVAGREPSSSKCQGSFGSGL